MPVSNLKLCNILDAMKPDLKVGRFDEGNDSLDNFVRQAIGKEPVLSYSRAGDSPVQWIQILQALDYEDLPGWPLLPPPKVQMQKCDKCNQEFCSPIINYRRHISVHRRALNNDKDFSKNRGFLGVFWDKLSVDEAKEVVSFKNITLESKEEYEASVCLCGSHICRGSYLNLTGEGAYQKVLMECHGILDRHQLMLEACVSNFVSEDDFNDLGRAGLGTCLLAGLPVWLVAYSARLVRFINYERTRLPEEILRRNLEEKRKFVSDLSVQVERDDAEIQAEGVYNQRLQNLALTLDRSKPHKPLNGQVFQICGDTVGFTAAGNVFVACNECAFPVCRACYDYERKDGNQSCPQCKTRYKRHKGLLSSTSVKK